MSEPEDRQARCAVEAEKAILAAALNDPRSLGEIRYLLTAADFYRPAHATIFAAIADLNDEGVTIDPLVVMGRLTEHKLLERVGGAPYLHTLYAFPFVRINIEHYADQLRNTARMRQLAVVGAKLSQIAEEVDDPDRALDLAAQQSIDLQLVVDEPMRGQIRGHYRLDDFLSVADDRQDWVIPDFLDRQDAFMLLGGEGMGKSWFLRQIALCVMAGVHPLNYDRRIPPKRAVLIDVENSEPTLRRNLRSMGTAVARLGHWVGNDGLELLSRPGGMNLRKREDALEIEKVISDFRPDVVCVGPLYKLAPRGRDDWDTAAAEARDVLDKWRERYGCAFVLEHHMPKGDGAARPETPFGGSEWMRWVTHGRILQELENGYFRLKHFRGDREVRQIPPGLVRGGVLPWSPVWDEVELDPTEGEPVKPKRGRK